MINVIKLGIIGEDWRTRPEKETRLLMDKGKDYEIVGYEEMTSPVSLADNSFKC